MNQEVKQELKRQGVVFSTKLIKMTLPVSYVFIDILIFCLINFDGVFPHANIMYHTSLKCSALILVSKHLFNRFINTTTMAYRWFSQ